MAHKIRHFHVQRKSTIRNSSGSQPVVLGNPSSKRTRKTNSTDAEPRGARPCRLSRFHQCLDELRRSGETVHDDLSPPSTMIVQLERTDNQRRNTYESDILYLGDVPILFS